MKSLILLIVTIWLLILNEEAYPTSSTDHNPFSICPYTGIPNRINTHKVPGINTGYLSHYPTQKQNKIILTLTKVQYLPIPSITNIPYLPIPSITPSTIIMIPNTYIKVPRRGFWGFRQTRQVITPLLYKLYSHYTI